MKLIFKVLIIAAILGAAIYISRIVDVNRILEAGSLFILAIVLLAETGFLIGFFLPGDTLLFAAGFFAAQGKISLFWALILLFLGTFIGNMIGYEIGKRTGHRVFKNEEALFFSKENITLAENFYKKHGGKTILIARFVPVIRTIVPPLAGMAKMNYRLFMIYNFIGGILWVGLVTIIGYWIGKVVGHYIDIEKYILPIVAVATIVSFGGSMGHVLKDPKARQKLKSQIKRRYNILFKKDPV